ncbi:MAG TPA: hypothetical protein PLK77_12445 [Pyrinomonadaceae bacterium]|nr:hypothetical protein [Pyrinomonadaceae bacterium]
MILTGKIVVLAAVFFHFGCFTAPSVNVPVSEPIAYTEPGKLSKPDFIKKSDGSYEFSTVYWATPRGVAEDDWKAVYGGTVTDVKKEVDDPSDETSRKFVSGSIRVEKIFRNLPDSSEIAIGSIVRSEDFDGLKKGDKAIIFIQDIYENGFVRAEIAGTNSKLGFKVETWNDPIVTALEKVARCGKIRIGWVEGHPKDFRAKLHDCYQELDQMILDDPQISEIWKLHDPEGFRRLLELRKMSDEETPN